MPTPETDTRLFAPGDLPAALGLLTRLPVALSEAAIARGARAAWVWPLAGMLPAALAAGLATAALAAGLGPMLAAGLALMAQIMLTGALHEDGLADCADGFWGGHDPARRLEIMKDSRIGSYGVQALILVTGLRWGALAALLAAPGGWVALLVVAALSRAAMVAVMTALPNARGGGLSASVGRPGRATAAVALLAGLAVALALAGLAGAVAALAAGLAAATVAALARGKIGGQTGDVLGAAQQLAEGAALLALVALLA